MAAKKVSKPTMAQAFKSASKKSGAVPVPPDRYPIPQKPTRTGPETESYVKTPKPQGPKRTGPERGPGAGARPPYGDTYGKPKPAKDGAALRAQARVVSAAEKRLEKEKKKFKDMQPTVGALPPTSPGPKKPKKPKRPKFGPGDSGGNKPLPGYFEV